MANPSPYHLGNHQPPTFSYTPPPAPHLPYDDWIGTLATIAKAAKNKARKITTDYTKTQIKKAISKYQQLYDKSPKKINRKVFKNTDTPRLIVSWTDQITSSQTHKKLPTRYMPNNL